jgi:peptidoglycan/xylan/chitin deacetylase (PgdA/CDA1 family)
MKQIGKSVVSNTYYRYLQQLHSPSVPKILMYHSIGGDDRLSVSKSEFKNHLDFYARYYQFGTLSEVLTEESDTNIALTFDDGYSDFYESVLPILRAENIPATVFVIAESLTDKSTSSSYQSMMGTDHLCELASEPLVRIGNHTLSHSHLDSLTPERQREEILRGKEVIEDCVGISVSQFAYPGGAYDENAVDLVQETHDCAVTVNKPWEPYSKYTLPRVHAHDQKLARWQLNSIAHLYHQYLTKAVS